MNESKKILHNLLMFSQMQIPNDSAHGGVAVEKTDGVLPRL